LHVVLDGRLISDHFPGIGRYVASLAHALAALALASSIALLHDPSSSAARLPPDLSALYSGAMLCVFPLLREGFGLPPLEAMACGTPVICSNASSLPEVVGDGGISFDPHDSGALLEAMTRAAGNSARAGAGAGAKFFVGTRAPPAKHIRYIANWVNCGESTRCA